MRTGDVVERPIVVIDDEPGVLDLLRDLLEFEGFGVVCFDHPEQLHALTPAANPSLFLIDIMLPGTSGIELAQQLRAEGFAATSMIATAASAFMVRTARSTELFQDTLSKPFDVANLLGIIERYI